MIKNAITRLQFLCDTIPPLLAQMDGQEFSAKPKPGKWSRKEIIGHLIDSATNNHQRFVRGQFEEAPTIIYDQNKWNEHNYYQQIDRQQVIAFWTVYNKQLLELIKHIPKEKLDKKVNTGDGNGLTLQYLIEDYVVHLEHHLLQVVSY